MSSPPRESQPPPRASGVWNQEPIPEAPPLSLVLALWAETARLPTPTYKSAYFLDPAVGFSMDHSFWIWEYWRKSQMWVPLTQVSHQLYLIVLYLTLVLIGVTILLVYYLKFEAVETATTVSRKIRTFRSIVRFLLSTLFSMFFISTFGVMMASIECNYEGPEMGNLKLFPGRACDEMPYIVHGLFALSGLVAFIAGRLQTLNPKP